MPSVMVTINGKNYRMACDEGQETHLKNLAEMLNGHVEQLKGSFGEMGDQRLTVMAGIMVTDEREELRKKVAKLEQKVEELTQKRELTLGEKDGLETDVSASITAAAEKLEGLSSKLRESLARQ